MTESAPGERPVVVSVAGSCATRDNFNSRFNPTYREHFVCPLHQNQTSMIALMAPPLDVAWTPTAEMSDYDKWNVDTEFSRSFLTEVAALQPRYLILDFFGDVHFGCLRLPGDDGPNWITDNRWKIHKTDWYAELQEAGGIDRFTLLDDTEAYIEEWTAAFTRFVEFAKSELPDTSLIVHKAPNVSRIRLPERDLPAPLRGNAKIKALDVERANELWRRLDDIAVEISGAAVIDLNDRDWCTWPDHPWGPFYVHYDPAYYHRFLAELMRIDAADRWGAEINGVMNAVAAAITEEAELFADEQEKRIVQLRRRVGRLKERVAQAEARPGLARRIIRKLR